MESSVIHDKPHVVCIPIPLQGHINPMLKLANLLHSKGFYITFVHTEFNYQRLLSSGGIDSFKGLPDFRFDTIPDGLPPTNLRGALDLPALAQSMPKIAVAPFHNLILKLNTTPDVPPVTCIISDGFMCFTLEVSEKLDIPQFIFQTSSACGLLGYLHYDDLVERGYFPLKDEDCLTNGYLDTPINWIPGMKGIRLKDLPTFLRTTDPNDTMFNYLMEQARSGQKAKGLILNTFDELEKEALDGIMAKYPQIYTIGPALMLCKQISTTNLNSVKSNNLWKEETECLQWLDGRDPMSVLYVNFGSLAIMTPNQLSEFAWGLANSKHPFLWVIRNDLVVCGTDILSEEFMEETRGRGLLSGWCPQEQVMSHRSIGVFLTHCGWNSTLESICEGVLCGQVMSHRSIGVFLTHCGWNSTLESICEGVPMICWPFFTEQQTNCFYIRNAWEIGMEIDYNVKRDGVEVLVRELMEGEKGKEMRKKTMEWKRKAMEAVSPGGSSSANLDRLIKVILEPGEI